jgi:hypothetical protein
MWIHSVCLLFRWVSHSALPVCTVS